MGQISFNQIPECSGMGDYNVFENRGDIAGYIRAASTSEREFRKALTASSGIVTAGTTGGHALGVQMLHDVIENTSLSQTDCVAMRLIPKGKAWATTVEYTTSGYPGTGGDGFADETGTDGAYGVTYQDDNFTRAVELVKYLAEARQISLPATLVRNITDPEKIERELATRALLAKAELALFYGNAGYNVSQFNGIPAQLMTWVNSNPQDSDILYDMGGQPIDKYALEDSCIVNMNKFGKGNLFLQSSTGYGDSNKLLFPEARELEGRGGTVYGSMKKEFIGPNGTIRVEHTPIMRPNHPLKVGGPGGNGLARTTAAAGAAAGPDSGSISFASNPFAASAAISAGTGSFWVNGNLNTDSAILTVPSVPSGGGNNTNRLLAGTYYYAVAPVFRGLEGPAYILGAGTQAANAISGSPTAITPTFGQVVKLDIDATTPAITGLGSTYAKANVSYRIYRFGGPGSAAPVNVTDFQYLATIGNPAASANARYVDNGFNMPGTDDAFLITTEKDGQRGWEFLQLCPLMKRLGLPNLPFAQPLVYMWFGTPILWRRPQHIWFRNVGRA